jgi:hypothetical protein
LGRAAQVDRNTSGRQSGQVFVDRPGGGAPSDQQGRACYDYDADHDSISLSPGMAGLLPFISFSTSYPELDDLRRSETGLFWT